MIKDFEEAFLGKSDFSKKVRKQSFKWLPFDVEIALAYQAMTERQFEDAFVHANAALNRLKPKNFDHERWATYIETVADIHLCAGDPNQAVQVLTAGVHGLGVELGEEHILTRHMEMMRSRLQWAITSDQLEAMKKKLDLSDGGVNCIESTDEHQYLVEAMSEYYGSWGRCMDVAKVCISHSQLYWAEVALHAAKAHCGGPDDTRFLETSNLLQWLYLQCQAPAYAEVELRETIELCRSSLGPDDPVTLSCLIQLKEFLLAHNRVAEADAVPVEIAF